MSAHWPAQAFFSEQENKKNHESHIQNILHLHCKDRKVGNKISPWKMLPIDVIILVMSPTLKFM